MNMRPVAQNGSELPLSGEFLEKKVIFSSPLFCSVLYSSLFLSLSISFLLSSSLLFVVYFHVLSLQFFSLLHFTSFDPFIFFSTVAISTAILIHYLLFCFNDYTLLYFYSFLCLLGSIVYLLKCHHIFYQKFSYTKEK